jgi:hypothetical protein
MSGNIVNCCLVVIVKGAHKDFLLRKNSSICATGTPGLNKKP